jgi:hypothetical protein
MKQEYDPVLSYSGLRKMFTYVVLVLLVLLGYWMNKNVFSKNRDIYTKDRVIKVEPSFNLQK